MLLGNHSLRGRNRYKKSIPQRYFRQRSLFTILSTSIAQIQHAGCYCKLLRDALQLIGSNSHSTTALNTTWGQSQRLSRTLNICTPLCIICAERTHLLEQTRQSPQRRNARTVISPFAPKLKGMIFTQSARTVSTNGLNFLHLSLTVVVVVAPIRGSSKVQIFIAIVVWLGPITKGFVCKPTEDTNDRVTYQGLICCELPSFFYKQRLLPSLTQLFDVHRWLEMPECTFLIRTKHQIKTNLNTNHVTCHSRM